MAHLTSRQGKQPSNSVDHQAGFASTERPATPRPIVTQRP